MSSQSQKVPKSPLDETPIDPRDGYGITPLSSDNCLVSSSHESNHSGQDFGRPTFSQTPEEHRASFLGSGSLITGSSLRHSRTNDNLVNYAEKSSKLQFVKELRTFRLIGNISKLFQWESNLKNDDELKKIKNKRLVKFYKEQNEMIELYSAIDKLLDSGIHHKMIGNYTERNDRTLNNIEESEEYTALKFSADHYGATEGNTGSSRSLESNEPPPVEHRSIHRRNSAVPGDIDLETGNLLGYNKAEGIKMVDFYIMLNFVTNIILLLGKSVVAILTSSISIVASLIDSALDFLSTGIIYLTNKLAQSKSSKDFPIGKNRLEPIGVLVFSIIIIISFIQVGIEAVNRLIHDSDKEIVEIGRNASIIMLLTIALKLACYLYGNTIESSGAEALAQDALVDVVFNSFSLLMPLLGYHFQIYWFDPLGAVLLSVYVVTLWCQTSLEHIIHLTGHKADPNDYRTILYLCMRFSEKISKIKDINCYYVGDSINVEIDVILDNVHDMRDSHDLAEALQYTLEALPMINIERAFVHTDYEVDNFKGHLKG